MFGNKYYYHESLRKYKIIFGNLFNELKINRDNGKMFSVPISYGPREKYLEKLESDPEIRKEVAIQLPRISYEFTSFRYDPDRKNSSLSKIITRNGKNAKGFFYNPVPYKIDVEMSVITKTQEDGLEIMEQILPFFTPEWHVQVRMFEEIPDLIFNIPIRMESQSPSDSYQGDLRSRREIIWVLNFSMDVFFFGPEKESKIIKLTKVNISNDPSFERGKQIEIKPGLTIDGKPTQSSEDSISHLDINPDDPYDYIVTIEEYNNEQK